MNSCEYYLDMPSIPGGRCFRPGIEEEDVPDGADMVIERESYLCGKSIVGEDQSKCSGYRGIVVEGYVGNR